MGYILSKYDDVRMEDNPVGVESRRESFVLTYEESDNSIEFKGAHLGSLIDALAVLKAYESDKSLLRPPCEEVAARWGQEEEDRALLDLYQDIPLEKLRRVVELRSQEQKGQQGAWDAYRSCARPRRERDWRLAVKIITRSTWGAAFSARAAAPQPRIDTIVIHHSAGPAGTCLEEGAHLVRGIQHDHMFRRKWLDTGYHFVIDGAGNVFQGREWTPVGEFIPTTRLSIGSHVKGANTGKVGVCVLGNYEEGEMSTASERSLIDLCSLLCQTYGLDPAEIMGHRDFVSTACPGKNLYGKLPVLRGHTREAMTPLSSRLRTALVSHRCVTWVDEDGEPSKLIDILSHGDNVEPGWGEIDAIVSTVLDVLGDKAD